MQNHLPRFLLDALRCRFSIFDQYRDGITREFSYATRMAKANEEPPMMKPVHGEMLIIA